MSEGPGEVDRHIPVGIGWDQRVAQIDVAVANGGIDTKESLGGLERHAACQAGGVLSRLGSLDELLLAHEVIPVDRQIGHGCATERGRHHIDRHSERGVGLIRVIGDKCGRDWHRGHGSGIGSGQPGIGIWFPLGDRNPKRLVEHESLLPRRSPRP